MAQRARPGEPGYNPLLDDDLEMLSDEEALAAQELPQVEMPAMEPASLPADDELSQKYAQLLGERSKARESRKALANSEGRFTGGQALSGLAGIIGDALVTRGGGKSDFAMGAANQINQQNEMRRKALDTGDAELKDLEILTKLSNARKKPKEGPDPLALIKARGDQAVRVANARAATANQTKNRLAPDKILQVQEGESIPNTLVDVATTLAANKDILGPVSGTLKSLNPYDSKAQTIDSQLRTASQQFGKYMEGGVLRKEDEAKYRKMFPGLSDTPEVAANKLQVVSRLLAKSHSSNLGALQKAGYDVSPFNSNLEIPDLPGILTGNADGAEPAADLNSLLAEKQRRNESRKLAR